MTKKNTAPKSQPAQKLRVWWTPQVPGKPFHTFVKTTDEAKLLLVAFARYDQFQLDNNIKPDYCNAGGLEMLEDGEWMEWNDEDGNSINDLMNAK